MLLEQIKNQDVYFLKIFWYYYWNIRKIRFNRLYIGVNSYNVLIRENGMTVNALERIKKQYYKYEFKKEGKFLFNEIKIIIARKCRK